VNRAIPALLLCLFSAACVSQPEIYAPPAQRKPLDQEILVRSQPMLEMSDPSVDRFIVSDIAKGQQPSPWRWTGKRPTVKIPLKTVLNLKYVMQFALPEATFKDTGPVTITFLVNDKELDKVKYDTPGDKTFEKLVPRGMLQPMSENTVAADVDKPWISKNDGQKLGLILVKIGLRQ
jgi:hypothetical protein